MSYLSLHSFFVGLSSNCPKTGSHSLRSTVRAFLKMLMSKQLASEYSWSGMGVKRKRIKQSFRDSQLHHALASKLYF